MPAWIYTHCVPSQTISTIQARLITSRLASQVWPGRRAWQVSRTQDVRVQRARSRVMNLSWQASLTARTATRAAVVVVAVAKECRGKASRKEASEQEARLHNNRPKTPFVRSPVDARPEVQYRRTWPEFAGAHKGASGVRGDNQAAMIDARRLSCMAHFTWPAACSTGPG